LIVIKIFSEIVESLLRHSRHRNVIKITAVIT